MFLYDFAMLAFWAYITIKKFLLSYNKKKKNEQKVSKLKSTFLSDQIM